MTTVFGTFMGPDGPVLGMVDVEAANKVRLGLGELRQVGPSREIRPVAQEMTRRGPNAEDAGANPAGSSNSGGGDATAG